jgi:hypothetical protein
MNDAAMSALGSKRVGFVMVAVCPIYPQQQTFQGPVGTSQKCQKPTSELERRTCAWQK